LDRVLKRCLEKDPENRWQTARDLKAEVEWIGNAPEPGKTVPANAPSPSRLGWMAAAVLALALIVVGALSWRASPGHVDPSLQPLVRVDLDLLADPPGLQGAGWAILSPDGSRLVYGSKGRLFTRRLDQPEAAELQGTETRYLPFFSPDGKWIAFQAQGKLQKIQVEGGAAIALCDASALIGGSWGEDGNLIANLTGPGGLSRIPSSGGAPTPVTELAKGEATHKFPQILPGGKAVLFTMGTGLGRVDEFTIEVMSLADRRRKTLHRGGTFGRYMAISTGAGYLTYLSQGTLFAVPFDLETLEVHGPPVPVLDRVAFSSQDGSGWFDVSRTGTLVYRSEETRRGNVIEWLDAAGNTQPLLAKSGLYLNPRLSPDGQRLALSLGDLLVNNDIWIYNWQRDTMSRVTFGGTSGDGPISPVWSPDGRFIVFGTQASGMFWVRADGAGKPQPLTQSKDIQIPTSFTPDGKRLVFGDQNPQGGRDLLTLPIENDGTALRPGKPEVFLATPFDENGGSFSPDGRWLAYFSNESGPYEVYVRAFPDKGSKWQISNLGGMHPLWSRNGRELFYRTLDNQIVVVNYAGKEDSFVADKPRVWSEKRIAGVGELMNYDLAPDGKRIAAIMPVEPQGAQPAHSHATLVLNFFDELRRRVPTGK
jgi:serine/threonine-protein kinase